MHINAYLMFNGTCKPAFEFYQQCFGGEIVAMLPFGENPECSEMSPEDKEKIMHARLVAGEAILMGSDCPASHEIDCPTGQPREAYKGFSVSLQIAEPDRAETVFEKLSQSGSVTMAMEETFWAKRFGMCVDQFGVPWMINCPNPEHAV